MSAKEQMDLYSKHRQTLSDAMAALAERTFYTPYPEHPKAYPADANEIGKTAFGQKLNENYSELNQESEEWIGEEVSPFWQTGLGVKYPKLSVEQWIANSDSAASDWRDCSLEQRAGILIESLDRVKERFFELAYATMHTTGQSFMMSFQASGPHGNDRALEAVAMGVQELSRFPSEVDWVKPMGKFDLTIKKNWKAIPKGIGLVIGCSTFPTWNSVPGLYANLICGNTALVKPHPKAVLPMAMVVAELRTVIKEQGLNPDIVQLTVDSQSDPITKVLAEDSRVKLIDYTGGNAFGDYIEGLNKSTFTEKAGVNSVIIDSVEDLKAVAQNIAFSASLYSGQMCTAPQNVFIAEEVKGPDGTIAYDQIADAISKSVEGIMTHPKMGAGTLGGIQNDQTIRRIKEGGNFGGEISLSPLDVQNEEFENARISSPTVVRMTADQIDSYSHECFGPIVFLIKTENTNESLRIASDLARTKGAITCLAFTTDAEVQASIEDRMNASFTPVSFNLKGAAFVNQHAAFSDFHVSGGNPAGNASFTNPEYINRRFVWVGNRYM